ncbi:MAG: helix-turn-helix domain-containing protein [Rhodobacterales bacterium]|nr:helix-turn-helix domain-containing protein [Rhodobacterales bacterium]
MTNIESEDWYDPETSTFGDRVAGAREQAGMDQALLAKRLGVKKSTLRAWENDLSEPRANKLSMMAGVLNVSLIWLLHGEGEGVEGPVDEIALDGDILDLLAEMRELKGQISQTAERLGVIEKRLRARLKAAV